MLHNNAYALVVARETFFPGANFWGAPTAQKSVRIYRTRRAEVCVEHHTYSIPIDQVEHDAIMAAWMSGEKENHALVGLIQDWLERALPEVLEEVTPVEIDSTELSP